jgi:Secretion system C-terminal sorting domain
MKKAILLMTFGVSSILLTAQTASDVVDVKSISKKVAFNQPIGTDNAVDNVQIFPGPVSKKSLGKFGDVYDFVQIGVSYYDLQTNSSIGRRSILHDDGTITMAWTYSGAVSTTFPDRGTGINHYDGSNWGSAPTSRTESSRTGWPSIGILEDGSIYTIAHDFEDGGLIMAKNSGKGKTDWSNGPEILGFTNGDPIWNRTANNGNIIHVLTNMSGQDDALPDVYIDSILNPTTYSRSLDGGKTWTDEHLLLPGYDSTRYTAGRADSYAIDVRDSVVAIVIGGAQKDLAIWKSTDNGDTWKKTVVDSFLYGLNGPYEWGSRFIAQADAIVTNDGALDILIDNNNDVHIVFGNSLVWDEDQSDEFMSVAQSFNLIHWSENSPEYTVCGTPIDMDNTGAYEFTPETTNSMLASGVPDGNLSYAARYGATTISTHPSLSVTDDNTIFVTYDAPVEVFVHDFNANFRDVHISYSTDDGASWAATQNATQLRNHEAVFACQTKRANDFVHFLFQQDIHPGTNLQNSGSGGLHPNVENIIQYAAIPVQDILDGNLGQHTLSNRSIEMDAKVFVVSQNYPNPFSASTNVVIYMRSGSDLSYTITDASGKVVSQKDLGYQKAGNHEITLDGNTLANGIYFYTLQTKDSEVTRKMNVVK